MTSQAKRPLLDAQESSSQPFNFLLPVSYVIIPRPLCLLLCGIRHYYICVALIASLNLSSNAAAGRHGVVENEGMASSERGVRQAGGGGSPGNWWRKRRGCQEDD